MLRGFYSAASGMMTQQRYQEALGNNIANANTPGYKSDQALIRSFPEMLIAAQGNRQLPTTQNVKIPFHQPIGSLNTGVYVQEYVPNFEQGDVRETNMPTDLALIQNNVPDETGGLFFRVQNEAGEESLTRNGNFTIDGDGFLVTNEGYYILSESGEPVQPGSRNFTVSNEGMLEVDGLNVQLGIGYTADVNELSKEDDNLFNGEFVPAPENADFSIHQGVLEGSNVDAARTMTEMMTAYRNFEMNQRVLRAYDESLGMAVSDIGRLT